MVRNYIKKTDRVSSSEDFIVAALNATEMVTIPLFGKQRKPMGSRNQPVTLD